MARASWDTSLMARATAAVGNRLTYNPEAVVNAVPHTYLYVKELQTLLHYRGQTTVENCIGAHDYKKTSPSKIQKIIHSNCHRLIDMLTKFFQNHIPPA